jgi:hypothetical protein
MVEINRIGGFPHSEIVGSKPAHGSPTLIAACHVLHRLYMPRHPRIALTSRLRVHTTNDNTGSTLRSTRNSAEQRIAVVLVRMILISARLFSELPTLLVATSLAAHHSTQSRYLHGIDFKNPFTMSKRVVSTQKPPRRRGGTVSLHPWKNFGERLTHAAPSVAAKLRLVARFAALAVLAMLELVEPIGIEPMT